MQPERPPGPTLPSIRTLHPYLPLPVVDPPQTVPPTPATASTSASAQAQQQTVSDVESDELDERETRERDRDNDPAEEPPKKKRRRAALSCTGASRKFYCPDKLLMRVRRMQAAQNTLR
uniref:Uncharacterized protein n=1 Tax=Mycena chlorophos TaxID=658473 RepID=A0ABQ0M4X9_MYCCL|nr:predicted protein [Mycena chlorophos]